MEPKIEYALEWTRLGRNCSSSDKLRKAALLCGEGSVHHIPTGNWGTSFLKTSSLKFLHFTAVVKKHIIFSWQVQRTFIGRSGGPIKVVIDVCSDSSWCSACQYSSIQHTCSLGSLHSKSCPLDSEKKKIIITALFQFKHFHYHLFAVFVICHERSLALRVKPTGSKCILGSGVRCARF